MLKNIGKFLFFCHFCTFYTIWAVEFVRECVNLFNWFMYKGFIFDLDGVIVDTAHYHYWAWKKAANRLGFDLTEEQNEELKGVSRVDSLKKILHWAGVDISEQQFEETLVTKNADYLSKVEAMTADEILPGVVNFLDTAKAKGISLALGSASKNAPLILKRVGLYNYFSVIVDGNVVTKAKPDPEVFLEAAKGLYLNPGNCVVFEDSVAGIKAAKAAGSLAVGIGRSEILNEADMVFSGFDNLTIEDILL